MVVVVAIGVGVATAVAEDVVDGIPQVTGDEPEYFEATAANKKM